MRKTSEGGSAIGLRVVVVCMFAAVGFATTHVLVGGSRAAVRGATTIPTPDPPPLPTKRTPAPPPPTPTPPPPPAPRGSASPNPAPPVGAHARPAPTPPSARRILIRLRDEVAGLMQRPSSAQAIVAAAREPAGTTRSSSIMAFLAAF